MEGMHHLSELQLVLECFAGVFSCQRMRCSALQIDSIRASETRLMWWQRRETGPTEGGDTRLG